MDRDAIRLARQLCCQAGIIMEDFAPLAVASPVNGKELGTTIAALSMAAKRMQALLDAAEALLR